VEGSARGCVRQARRGRAVLPTEIRLISLACDKPFAMRALGWLLQLWHRIEPAERLDWILETLGLRERVHQIIAAGLGGIVMLIVQRLRDAPIDWTILMVFGTGGLVFYFLNQLSQWSNIRSTHNALRALNPNAQPTISFFTGKRISRYIITAVLAMFALSLHRGPSGIEWPWSRGISQPSPPAQPSAPEMWLTRPLPQISDLLNPQLRDRASRFSQKLREFEAEFKAKDQQLKDEEWAALPRPFPSLGQKNPALDQKWHENQDADMKRSREHQTEFRVTFLGEARLFRYELNRRRGVFPPYQPHSCAPALDDGVLAGPYPILEVANCLDDLIRKLPD
jgi:hypothetical protein